MARGDGAASRRVVAFAVVLAALVLAGPAEAATNTFTGAIDNNWNAAGNWSDGVPTPDDAVFITSKTVSLTGAAASAATISHTAGSHLTVSGTTLTLGSGSSTIASGVDITGGGIVNLGTSTTWSGGTISFHTGGGTIQIGVGDVLDITGASLSSLNFAGGLWRNEGTVNRTTSATVAQIGVPFENDGTVNVNVGTFEVGQGDGAGSTSGVYLVAAGANLALTGGGVELGGAGSRIGGAGTVALSSSLSVAADATFDPTVLTIGGGTLTLVPNATVPTLTTTGGTRTGAGTLTVTGVASLGGLTLDGAATTNLTGSAQITSGLGITGGHTLEMPPTATWSGGSISFNSGGGTLHIGVGDVLDITGASLSSLNFNNGLWRNDGTVNRTTSATVAQIGVPFENSGTIDVDTGTLAMDQGLTQTAGVSDVAAGATLGGTTLSFQGGALQGAGTAGGNVTNSGATVRPGSSPGKLTIGGNYTQGPGGTLVAEIAGTAQGTEYDWLAVTGTATLDGTLAIQSAGGFDPALTATFTIVTAATRTGQFATLTGTQIPGKAYFAQYTAAEALLALTEAPANSAAPSIPSAAKPGDTLTCSSGTWGGSPTIAFQWLRDGTSIPGATASTYTVTAEDSGKTLVCRVTATNAGGSTSADSNGVLVATPAPDPVPDPQPTPDPVPDPQPTPDPTPDPSPVVETIRGEEAFSEGSAADLHLACTKLDLILIDVLRKPRRKVLVAGVADLRLVGRRADILLDGQRVGRAAIRAGGLFSARVPAPAPKRARHAEYQARVGRARSQRLDLERRMVAGKIVRKGNFLVLRGQVTRPFAARPAVIQVERFVSCGRREKVKVATVRPNARGVFAVRIPVPAGVNAAIYRAFTRVALERGGRAVARSVALPQSIDLR